MLATRTADELHKTRELLHAASRSAIDSSRSERSTINNASAQRPARRNQAGHQESATMVKKDAKIAVTAAVRANAL